MVKSLITGILEGSEIWEDEDRANLALNFW